MIQWLRFAAGAIGRNKMNWIPAASLVVPGMALMGTALLSGCGKAPAAAGPPAADARLCRSG